MKFLSALLVGALVFAACDTADQPTDPRSTGLDKRTQVVDVIEDVTTYDCCGNEVVLNGSIHRNYEIVQNEDGSWSIKYHANWQNGTGLGANGTKYKASGSATLSQTVNADNSGSYKIVHHERFVVVGKGDGCSFKIKVVLSVHIDSDGNIVVDNEHISVECE